MKKHNQKSKKWFGRKEKRRFNFFLPQETRQMILGILMILAAIIIGLGFFNKAGKAGDVFIKIARLFIGDTIFLAPLILILGGLAFLVAKGSLFSFKEKNVFWSVILAVLALLIGITGMLGAVNPQAKKGGWLGYFITLPLLKYFAFWATQLIFLALISIGILIFWQIMCRPSFKKEGKTNGLEIEERPKTSIIGKIFAPSFKVKEISSLAPKETKQIEKSAAPLKSEARPAGGSAIFAYQPPPLDLLDPERGAPTSGDTGINSSIIKKTLQNFGIDVAMSEVNIGPTVTQYTLKPAEGVKLSKITALSNDLSLALASHPIRIEAPIPGRSLVGIEIPNKIRAQVRLRNLLEYPDFQKSAANLVIALGRDVSGVPVFADLTRMPHLLVAGSTGTGKTIFLNSLVLSLLYQPSTSTKSASPESLKFILVDPKRVEFPVYENLPHLLCPVIYNASQTIVALKWLTREMERRFDVLSAVKARDIGTYNERALKEKEEPLPFIIVIIDELADLMAVKGREIEVAIVRLAQMARAVGIHLVVATQRPSVEVITGLIKANITSRVTFQVASQVDSRTILDSSGAEKLLGFGDMLFVSAEISKPKRIQGAFASDKEVKRVVKYIVPENEEEKARAEMDEGLVSELEANSLESEKGEVPWSGSNEEGDSLYNDAKRAVLEAKKASASLLQRRLRIGYARAARLIDMLEDRGVVGPGEGAKPREIIGGVEDVEDFEERVGVPPEQEEHLKDEYSKDENKEEWEKV